MSLSTKLLLPALALLLSAVLARSWQLDKARDKLALTEQKLADKIVLVEELEFSLEAERKATLVNQALLESVQESERRVATLSSALDKAISGLGKEHESEEPCYYAIPSPDTLDALDGLQFDFSRTEF